VRYARASSTRRLVSWSDLIPKTCALRLTVFSITFSLCEVPEAITALDFPSQTSSSTSLSKGVNSLVEILMFLIILGTTLPRPSQYVPIFSISHPVR
jgi:hypothetical protein